MFKVHTLWATGKSLIHVTDRLAYETNLVPSIHSLWRWEIWDLEHRDASDQEVIRLVCRTKTSKMSYHVLWLCTTRRSIPFFTITAEIHARSLANFYDQYADGHMNSKFIGRVSERARAIRQFIIVENKLMSVFNASVLLLTMSFVITLSK